MKYGNIKSFQTGVAVPVSSLKSEISCGVGEYYDLIELGEWASQVGLDLIQILPINDSGETSSPYSAISAFALHPIYLRLSKISGASTFKSKINEYAKENTSHLEYHKTLKLKESILIAIYHNTKEKIQKNKTLTNWIKKNTWIKIYCVYRVLREELGHNWQSWPNEFLNPTSEWIQEKWNSNFEKVLYYAWVQKECEKQLRESALALDKLNVKLKGDIPILISEDSADAWGNSEIFSLADRAGAPPDMFCQSGQNWGFPCYQWDKLETLNYSWWKERLDRASLFYHAFRIDHVLGFFRIWQIAQGNRTGMMGRFVPENSITPNLLESFGIAQETAKWLATPSFSIDEIHSKIGTVELSPWFFESNNEWFFHKNIQTENQLLELAPEKLHGGLLQLFWDRIFLQFSDEHECFHPFWTWYSSSKLSKMGHDLKEKIENLIHNLESSQEELWANTGHKLLEMMSKQTDMLVCAEDLGVVPNCVPKVLGDLGILSLKIERWARDYNKESQPFIEVENYPRLSVNTPSCHDTSTIRGLWQEDDWGKDEYIQKLNISDTEKKWLEQKTAKAILAHNLSANSLLSIIPLQDWTSISYNLRSSDPYEERINEPGSLDSRNWSWRHQYTLTELKKSTAFNTDLQKLVNQRKLRALK